MNETQAEAPAASRETLDFLMREAWPQGPPEVVETHMSWVFLTGRHAYKLKKPVRHAAADYRTLESRRVDCEAEVRLNQALAPDVYLGTTPLTRDDEGRLSLGRSGSGEIVDWLVVMRRLPSDGLLDRRIARHDVALEDVDVLVSRLCDFYRSSPRWPREPLEYRRSLAEQVRLDRWALLDPSFGLDGGLVREISDSQLQVIASLPDLADRATHVVEGHGDLRPEHVLLGPGTALVIDRLSFDRSLRTVDPVFDLGLLAVECELGGAAWLGDRIVLAYQRNAPDEAGAATDALYRSIRAVTRSRLSIEHLRDGGDEEAKWRDRTVAYLDIAARSLDRCRQP